MGIFTTVLLVCVGFGYYVADVRSDELDLGNVFASGFPIKKSSKNSALYTEIYPRSGKGLTRVVNGQDLVWEARGDEQSRGVTHVQFPNTRESILFVEILDKNGPRVKYYGTLAGIFHEISQVDYNLKLSQMARLPSLGKVYQQVDDDDDDDLIVEELFGFGDPDFDSDDSETFEDVLEEQSRSFAFKGRQRDSAERISRLQRQRRDEERRTLYITDPSRNELVDFEYEINDGVPTLRAFVRKGKLVTAVREGANVVWEAAEGQSLEELTAYSQYREFRLVEIIYLDGGASFITFFRKEGSTWHEMPLSQGEAYFKQMRAQIVIRENICMDLAKVDAQKYYSKSEESSGFTATTYFPLTGYLLSKVRDGERVVWRSTTRRCVAATVVRRGDHIMFLKLEILNRRDKSKNRFFKKERGRYYRLDEQGYEALLEYYSSGAAAELGGSVEELGVSDQEYEVDDSNEYDQDDLIPLEILSPDHACSSDEAYKGVQYRTLEPHEGVGFNSVSLGGVVIWKGLKDEFTDFVRIFYLGGAPSLCLIRLMKADLTEDRDIYFVKRVGAWVQVSSREFIEDFNSHTTE